MRDAAFLPSMETALSLVMDARPVVGEKVAVVGQGLIGQLVAAVMAKTSPPIPSSPSLTQTQRGSTRLAAG